MLGFSLQDASCLKNEGTPVVVCFTPYLVQSQGLCFLQQQGCILLIEPADCECAALGKHVMEVLHVVKQDVAVYVGNNHAGFG